MMFDLTGFIICGFIIVVILGPPIIKKIRRKKKAAADAELRELKELVGSFVDMQSNTLKQYEETPLYMGAISRDARLENVDDDLLEVKFLFASLSSHPSMARELMLHKKLTRLLQLIEGLLLDVKEFLDSRDGNPEMGTYKHTKSDYDEFTALTKTLFNFKYYQQ